MTERKESAPGLSLPADAGTRRDRIFAEPKSRIDDFNFGRDTAVVFDDMLGRSVPHYAEIQRMTGELVGDYAADGTAIYESNVVVTLPSQRDAIKRLRSSRP